MNITQYIFPIFLIFKAYYISGFLLLLLTILSDVFLYSTDSLFMLEKKYRAFVKGENFKWDVYKFNTKKNVHDLMEPYFKYRARGELLIYNFKRGIHCFIKYLFLISKILSLICTLFYMYVIFTRYVHIKVEFKF
jgi:hypothetical protein